MLTSLDKADAFQKANEAVPSGECFVCSKKSKTGCRTISLKVLLISLRKGAVNVIAQAGPAIVAQTLPALVEVR